MKKKIGFIGYGLRSETMMKAFRSLDADIRVAGISDPRESLIREQVKNDPYFSDTVFYESAEALLYNDGLDGVFIGTRCNLHTELACMVLKQGIPLFLEKPVCINRNQYETLRDAAVGKEHHVVVSFPLRVSMICKEMRRIVESGELGRITMVQAVNTPPYGSVYYHSWYRDPSVTGGLFLQKATHDMDYINYLLDEIPVHVYAKTAKLHFKGDHPADLRCEDCSAYYSCTESSYVVSKILKEDPTGNLCCFAVDTGNEDCAAAVYTTESGCIVSYCQNFVVKKSAARRGARLIGTKGSAEFDWYTGEIRRDMYFTPQTAVHKFSFADGNHFGGDEMLALEFLKVMDGQPSESNLTAGLQSAAACLAAKESADTEKPVNIHY